MKDMTLTRDNVVDFEIELMAALTHGYRYSPNSAYKVYDGTIIRVKDHDPNWYNFREDVECFKQIINVTVGNFNGSSYDNVEDFQEDFDEVKIANITVSEGDTLDFAVEMIRHEIYINDIDYDI